MVVVVGSGPPPLWGCRSYAVRPAGILAISNAGLIELVEVATGNKIPLPFTRGLLLPGWRP